MKTNNETKTLEYYLKTNYPVTVYPAPEGGYVAEIEDLPGCITEGETLEEVFERIEDARRIWIEVQFEEGEQIPVPRTELEYSGKFLVRIPRTLHRQLATQAQRENVSLNQYIETLLAGKAALKDFTSELTGRMKNRLLTRFITSQNINPVYFFQQKASSDQPMSLDKFEKEMVKV